MPILFFVGLVSICTFCILAAIVPKNNRVYRVAIDDLGNYVVQYADLESYLHKQLNLKDWITIDRYKLDRLVHLDSFIDYEEAVEFMLQSQQEYYGECKRLTTVYLVDNYKQ